MEDTWKDISTWCNKPTSYIENLRNKNDKKPKAKLIDLRTLEIDHVKLYCLLKAKVSPFPNGVFTFLIHDKPIANPYWWDFIVESEIGSIHFFRSQSHVTAKVDISEKSFDLLEFINFNFKKYEKEIKLIHRDLEEHTLYINHYDSYKKCVDDLWELISDLKIEPLDLEKEIKLNPEKAGHLLQTFMKDNVRFHTMSKSLLLNAAFKIESYLNLLIRLTAKQEIRDYPHILKKHLNSNFSEKLKSLKFYSILIEKDVDLNNKAVQDAQKVMTYRNKYVHFDLSSELNKIGMVNFDLDFPVFGSYKDSPIIENTKRSFQIPTFDIVKFSFEASNNFVNYIDNLLEENPWSDAIRLVMSQNPIGFNEKSKVYSAIFSNTLFDVFPQQKTEDKTNEL